MCDGKLSEGAAAKFAELGAFIEGLGIDPKNERRRGYLIQVLHKAQEIFGYLPREVQAFVAKKLYLPEAAISGGCVTGAFMWRQGLGTACYVKGSETVLQELERVLGVKADTVPTADGLFSITALRCVGCCGLAPVMRVNGKVYAKVTPAKAREVVEEIKAKEAK